MDFSHKKFLTIKSLITILLIALYIPAYPQNVLSDEELKAIDNSLLKILMTRQDAEFTRIGTEDETMLPYIKTMIDKPFKAPQIVSDLHSKISSCQNPYEILEIACDILNIKPEFLDLTDIKNREKIDTPTSIPADFPDQLKKGIELIINATDIAYKEINDGYNYLDKDDWNFIKEKIDPIFNPGIELDEDEDLIEKNVDRIKGISKKLQLSKIISAAHLLMNASREFESMLLSSAQIMNSNIDKASISLNSGMLEITGVKNDIHEEECSIIIDLGGDDCYEISGSGENNKLLLIIDLFGNDNYKVGASSAGITIIIDSAGDDLYDGKGFCLGAGIFGAGVLWDKSGDDIYKSDFASLGFGANGIGLLLDDGGNDLYTSSALSQGASILSGIGILLDRSGNDIYRAGDKYPDNERDPRYYLSMSQGFALGLRPFISGGFGILIDDSGSDKYSSGIFGQGAGYWHSAGLLWDNSGDDMYISRQYSQGCGIHSGAGFLVDMDGNDRYDSYSQAQGCGYDLAIGFLIDKAGDDSYLSEWHVQGAGARNSFALFLDSSGKDRYITGENTTSRGYADRYRDFGGIGLFLDMKGIDIFIPPKPTNETFWSVNPYSIGFDGE